MAARSKPSSGPCRPTPVFGSKNYLLLVLGILLLMIGYIVLGEVNARADNWQGLAAPLLLGGGYLLIFFGILIRPSPRDPAR